MTAKTMLAMVLGIGLLSAAVPASAAQIHVHNMTDSAITVKYSKAHGFSIKDDSSTVGANASVKIDTSTSTISSISVGGKQFDFKKLGAVCLNAHFVYASPTKARLVDRGSCN